MVLWSSSFETGLLLPVTLILNCTEGQRPTAVLCLIKDFSARLEFDESSQESGKHAKACVLFICISTAFMLENCMVTNTNKLINRLKSLLSVCSKGAQRYLVRNKSDGYLSTGSAAADMYQKIKQEPGFLMSCLLLLVINSCRGSFLKNLSCQ